MSLKKPSLSPDRMERIWELVSQELSGMAISKQLKVSQSTLWRNMQLLGINKKQRKAQKQTNEKFFDWNDYKDKSLI